LRCTNAALSRLRTSIENHGATGHLLFKTSKEITMYSVPEQLTTANKAGVETLVTIANTAFSGAERLAALNLNAVRTLLDESTTNIRTLLSAKDMRELVSMQTTLAQPALKKASTYSRRAYQIAAETQGAISEVIEGRVTELAKSAGKACKKTNKAA
jgi:phasin family protein